MIGIVVEYNPFHNGHIRQLAWIKKEFPNEKIVIVMSDKFSQRGELIVAPFKQRKKIAKKYGVNKVLKLSLQEGVQAAHIFAKNAINKLYKYGINKLVFGSESNNPEQMIKLAQFLNNNQTNFDEKIRYNIKQAKLAYPKAYQMALENLSGQSFIKPNDILGFEYTKVIVNNNWPIKIFTLARNVDFHSQETNQNYASASLLRNMLLNNQDITYFSPMKIKKMPNMEKFYSKFKKIMSTSPLTKIKKIPLVSEGIENLFLKHLNCRTYNEFIENCTSKRYTASRIKRIMAWIVTKQWKKL
ncbi:nucleotidyltransferase [Mycoplasmopsis iners]|uniref:nucleotidyltransferase n=1 Tax=Mycoplasmopsis iners TaxID=76630 RepID=UPI000496ADBD|nr:nucleotidyltransferase [Mycoplasmopsis iners]